MKILIIDNFDSFTFNLYQLIGKILISANVDFDLKVKRNDQVSLEEIERAKYDRIIISPGPGEPDNVEYFGVCKDVLLNTSKNTPVFGVCLGMQGLAHYYGAKIVRAFEPVHGKLSKVTHDGKGVFKDLPQNISVMRYHSLLVDPNTLPDCLEVSAKVDNQPSVIMGLRHKKYPLSGVQFHPESFATEGGKQMLINFLFNNK